MSDVLKKYFDFPHLKKSEDLTCSMSDDSSTVCISWICVSTQRHSGSDPSNLFTATYAADGSHHNGCFQLLLLLLTLRKKQDGTPMS